MSCFVALLGLTAHHRLCGEPEQAWHFLDMANADFIENWNGPPQLLAFREASAAMLHLDAGDAEPAREALSRAFRYGLISRDMPIQARMAVGAARYADVVGQSELAMRLLGASEAMLGTADQSDPDRVALVKQLAERPEYQACYAAGKSATRAENQVLVARTLGLPPAVVIDPNAAAHTLRP
jgi:hypothetical protein